MQSFWIRWEKVSKFRPQKVKKLIFWAQKWRKMTKKSKNFQFFLVGIDLDWSKTWFKTKISSLKIFSVENYFFRDIAVFPKNGNYRLFVEHASIVKGTCMYDAFKNQQKFSKISVEKFCSRNFFWNKIFEEPLFWAIFGKKFDKSSEPIELNRRED